MKIRDLVPFRKNNNINVRREEAHQLIGPGAGIEPELRAEIFHFSHFELLSMMAVKS